LQGRSGVFAIWKDIQKLLNYLLDVGVHMLQQRHLDAVIDLCHDVSARIHQEVTGNVLLDPTLYSIVAFKLFGYSLNTFKSIFYLLTVYEQAMALQRTLWETGLNFEWISRDAEARAQRFLQFTIVEQRKFIRKRIEAARRAGDSSAVLYLTNELRKFDDLLGKRLSAYEYKDKKQKTKYRDRFSGPSLDQVVREVGGEWLNEYDRDYALGCMSSHGSPGAVLFPLVDASPNFEASRAIDVNRSALVGVMAIEVISRSYRLYLPVINREDEAFLLELQGCIRAIRDI